MSEDATAPDESGASAADTSGLAVDLAMEEARSDPSLREDVAAFLRDQRGLIADQRHHMREQYKQVHLVVWEKRLGVLLRVATAVVGIALATAAGSMVWDAAHSKGLVIEPFSVPPDLAERGLTGQVVATRLLDKISAMQSQVNTVRAQNSYINNWGNNIKIEIPETGVSLSEVEGYLREKLGHDTHITGDVVRTGANISVTARAGIDAAKSFSGSESDADALLQNAAEAIYASTQPYRYGIYLLQHGKAQEGADFFASIAGKGSPSERAWAYTGWYTALGILRQSDTGKARAEKADLAVALYPNFAFGWNHVGVTSRALGHEEAALAALRKASRLLDQHIADDIEPAVVPRFQQEDTVYIDELLGDYADALAQMQGLRSALGAQKEGTTRLTFADLASTLIGDHDLAGAVRLFSEAPTSAAICSRSVAFASEDWPRALQFLRAKQARGIVACAGGIVPVITEIGPDLAFAEAKIGDFAAAHAQIDRTPGDCYECVDMRGRIDAEQGNFDGAAFWFAKATKLGPSLPLAHADWGQMLLKKGEPDAAIAQFKLSNLKGPHFADPLEYWGEALMAKNQSHLALEKFAQAEKYAPNWGRLHLKWGEALAYSGKKDDAQKQLARAARLDLTPSEKSELARQPLHD